MWGSAASPCWGVMSPRGGLFSPRASECDVVGRGALTEKSYLEVDRVTRHSDWPEPQIRPPDRQGHCIARARHTIATDPDGCWVAGQDGELVGCAISRTRELMWILASFAVQPGRDRKSTRLNSRH